MNKNYFLLSAMLLCIAGCTHNHSGSHPDNDAEHHEESSLTTVHIDSLDRDRLGIYVTAILPDTFRSAVKVSGEIIPSATSQAIITAPTSGNIHFKNDIRRGSVIRSGESIGYIDISSTTGSSTEKVNAAELNAARREYERIRNLKEEGLATQAELNAALARLESARAALNTMALSGNIISPITGTVSEVYTSNGAYMNPGDPVVQIIKSDDLTLRVDIPERYRSVLSNLTGINLRPAGTDAIYSVGKDVIKTSDKHISDSRGYIPLALSFPNPGLKTTGIYADVYLLSTPKTSILSVPVTSLIEDQGSMFIYVAVNDHEFERRMVTTGEFDGSRIEIVSGLKPGEKVAVEGASMLRMAQAQSSPVEGHHHH